MSKRQNYNDVIRTVTSLSITMTIGTLSKLDSIRVEHPDMFLSRSDEIEKMCGYYIESQINGHICPVCGTKNEKNARFCNHCGTELGLLDAQKEEAILIFRELYDLWDNQDIKYRINLTNNQIIKLLSGEIVEYSDCNITTYSTIEIEQLKSSAKEIANKIKNNAQNF